MTPANHHVSPRRALANAVLFALLGIIPVSLTQCRPVNDEIVRPQAASASNCFTDCAHAYTVAIQAESALHVANVHACAGDSTCLANEETRHEAAVAAINAAQKACQDRCHQQGGGSGGQ